MRRISYLTLDMSVDYESKCRDLLKLRENGVSFAAFVGKFRRRYLLRVVLLIANAFLVFSGDEVGKVCGLLATGMIVGMVIQDFS